MSIITALHLNTLQNFYDELKNAERKLAQLVELDVAAAKADLEAGIEHFKAEIARIKSKLDPKVVAHLDEGAPPHIAGQLAAQGVPTQAEANAAALAEQTAASNDSGAPKLIVN